MAYNSGDLILDDHYNLFATGTSGGAPNPNVANVNAVNGWGDLDKGYGQSGDVPPVSAGTQISATQWATMFTKIGTMAAHQGITVGPEPLPTVGKDIDAVAVLSTDISAIYNNRLNAVAQGSFLQLQTTRTTQWRNVVTMTQTVTFSGNNQLRWFFNAGGLIRVEFQRDGGDVNDKNTAWTNLCTACGIIYLSSAGTVKTIATVNYNGTTKIGGSGTINNIASGTGIKELPVQSVKTLIFRQYYTSTYSSNKIDVFVQRNNNVLTLTTEYHDDANGSVDEYVNGTLRTGLTASYPSSTYLTNSWGTVQLSGSQTGS